jgi:cyclopropane-fatty-acyl-phospholipid synthase
MRTSPEAEGAATMKTASVSEHVESHIATPDGVEIAREILRRAFAGVNSSVGVKLADGMDLHQPTRPVDATIVLGYPGVLKLLLTRASDLAAGEAVVRGDIDVEGSVERAFEAMDEVAEARSSSEWVAIASLAARLPRMLRDDASRPGRAPANLRGRIHSPERDRAAIAYHYDLSNDFYELWLDKNMIYSCAYFQRKSDALDQAQMQKCDLICRKLRLKQGERLLDVGCGWGGLVRFAAREYGAQAVGVTLSRRQVDYARARIENEGLERQCRIEPLDYRELAPLGQFDKIASVGMVEHVGDAMMPTYFQVLLDALAPGGLFLNHGIVSQQPRISGLRAVVARFFPQRSRFTESYVFPDGEMPRLPEMTDAAQSAGFEVRDIENLREHYTLTLRHWLSRLEAHSERARVIVGDPTYNVWRFWLAGSAHSFATGRLGVVQMLLAKFAADGKAQIPMTRADIYGQATWHA